MKASARWRDGSFRCSWGRAPRKHRPAARPRSGPAPIAPPVARQADPAWFPAGSPAELTVRLLATLASPRRGRSDCAAGAHEIRVPGLRWCFISELSCRDDLTSEQAANESRPNRSPTLSPALFPQIWWSFGGSTLQFVFGPRKAHFRSCGSKDSASPFCQSLPVLADWRRIPSRISE